MMYAAILFKYERERKKNMCLVSVKTNTSRDDKTKQVSQQGSHIVGWVKGHGQMGTVKGRLRRPRFPVSDA